MSALATDISALTNTGLEAYEVSQGAPVALNTSTVAGVPVTSVSIGSVLTGNSGLILIVAIAAILAYFIFGKK